MIYASPVRADLASGAYYDVEAAEYYLSPAKLAGDYSDVRFERELRIFRRHFPSGRILDVGCSSGGFLYQLRKRFPGDYELLGTDASGLALDYAEKEGLPVLRGDFLKHDFGETKFDAVTFWAVLEHVIDPAGFLDKAADVLAHEGLCFVLVPNMRSLASRVLGAKYRYIYPQHLNYFTRQTLESVAQKRFDVVACYFTHFNPIVIWQDWQRGGREVSNEERGRLLRKTTSYKQQGSLKPVRMLYNACEKALGALSLADNIAIALKKQEK